MRPDVIDRLGDAGVATINLAVDSVEERKELPKSLAPIRPYFDYLIKKQYVYGFSVFLNINITRINLHDVIELTEIAHDVGIATDYHINETPMLEQPDFRHESGNSTYITPEDWPRVDAVIDWLIAKNRSGYKMVNSVRRLEADESVHARQVAAVGLPRRPELVDHPHGWHAGPVLSHV